MKQAGLPLTSQKALPTTTLIHGDCLDVMPTLPAASVQMVFADSPYCITQNKWDLPICPKAFWGALSHSRTDNTVTIISGDFRFGALMMAANQQQFRYDMVWHKVNRATGFLNAKIMPLRSHEHLLLFCNSRTIYNPIIARGKPWNVTPAKKANNGSNYGHFEKQKQVNNGTRLPTSVLAIACEYRKRVHPTQKPVALLEWLIRTYTNEGDTVLDPVFGSCTTGVACLRTGRNFIGIEKDKTYFDVGSKRVADERARLENT